jgi:pseudaminic acid cytidylyltransferase
MTKIAIIPARGGSKRIPRKNIKDFGGRPIIAWPILTALTSKCFDAVIVSTDDLEIASIAEQYGAEVPFRRPPELSDDYVGTVEVISHAIDSLKGTYRDIEQVCCIYPTAALLNSADLTRGYDQLIATNSDYAIGVTDYGYPIQRALKVTSSGEIEMFFPENYQKRSQDLERCWHDAGLFCWGTTDAWTQKKAVFHAKSSPIFISRWQVQDIDTREDWDYALKIFNSMKSS